MFVIILATLVVIWVSVLVFASTLPDTYTILFVISDKLLGQHFESGLANLKAAAEAAA